MGLPDTLVLDLNNVEMMDSSLTFKSLDRSQSGKSTWIEEGSHTTTERHMLDLYRTPSSPSGTNLGTRRCAVKFTDDFVVKDSEGNDVVRPAITQVSFALPEGLTDEQCRWLARKASRSTQLLEGLDSMSAGQFIYELRKLLKYGMI